jgi:hypothetical protein
MPKEEYFEKNTALVILFIIWCIALYLTFQASAVSFWDKLLTIFKEASLKDGLLVAMSPIIALILTGIISPTNKARLVFWKWKHTIPGHKAFSKLAPDDPRIDMAKLRQKIGSVPTDPVEQNSLWYAIYKKYSKLPTVIEPHKSFLLARDLASIAFLFAILGPWGLLLFKHKGTWVLFYFIVMMVHYVVLSIVAQNHAKRFVCNVLAEYTVDSTP